MLGAAITISIIVGWVLGFVSYWAVRMGVHAVREILEEEKSTKKEPLVTSDQLN